MSTLFMLITLAVLIVFCFVLLYCLFKEDPDKDISENNKERFYNRYKK